MLGLFITFTGILVLAIAFGIIVYVQDRKKPVIK